MKDYQKANDASETDHRVPTHTRIGTKLVAAVQMKSTFVAAVVSMLYSLHRYSIMFGISPLLAMFSNASFVVQEENPKKKTKE